MNLIHSIIDWVFDPDQTQARRADEAFLAESVDMLDLERRMRELDQRRAFGPFGSNA